MSRAIWVGLAGVVGMLGCASAPQPTPAPAPISHPPPIEAPAPLLPAPIAAASAVVHRRTLDAVLADSPGRFLQHVDVEPHFAQGRFSGWRLKALFPGDPRLAGVDLQAGDVVVQVNGVSLEQPDDLARLWQALRGASALDITVERAGAPRHVHIPVVED